MQANKKWLLEQQMGGICDHVFLILKQRVNPWMAVQCGMHSKGVDSEGEITTHELDYDDELATFCGRYTTNLAAFRLRIIDYLFGHPHKMAIYAHTKNPLLLQEFKKAHDAAQSLRS